MRNRARSSPPSRRSAPLRFRVTSIIYKKYETSHGFPSQTKTGDETKDACGLT